MSKIPGPGDEILVTGCAGRLGCFVVEALGRAGFIVRGVDRVRPRFDMPGRLVLADAGDEAAMIDAAEGCVAVAHLAALPDPHAGSPFEVLTQNIRMAGSAVLAAKSAGVARFVLASSQAVLGMAWADQVRSPRYVPIDENHPLEPEETYGLSKVASEDLCRMLSRNGPPSVALRFPAIWDADRFESHVRRRVDDPVQAAKSNWAYIDGRDAGRAVIAALTAPIVGFKAYNIAAPEVFSTEGASDLVRAWYPGTSGGGDVRGRAAIFDSGAAERDLGFRARYLWSLDGVRDMQS